MAKILSVMSAKGGTSKTTLSLNLFFFLKNKGKRVLFVDTDAQSSGYNVLEEMEENSKAFINNSDELQDLLASVKNDFDYFVIDTSPTISHLNTSIMKISDKILITSKPSKLDIQSIYNTLELSKMTEAKLFLVFTQVINNSTITKENLKELTDIFSKEQNLTLIKTPMSQATAYLNSINDLSPIFSTKNQKQKAELTEIFSVFLN